MRRIEQKQLLDVITTARHGVETIKTKNLNIENTKIMLDKCLQAVEAVENAVHVCTSADRQYFYNEIFHRISSDMMQLRKLVSEADDKNLYMEKVKNDLDELHQGILDEIDIEYVVLFLPYKASMWDSMESIWAGARADSRCSVYTAVIPYFDRNPDGSFGEMHYEGTDMPDYVDVVDYRALDMDMLQPDVVYIHNPYDQYNFVTSVHPAFYSKELKKYTECLVYVSYYIPGVYSSIEASAVFCQSVGMVYSDVIVAQSEVHKYLLEANGNKSEKIAVLGNPKLDYIVNHIHDRNIPSSWEKKLAGKKVFLVCGSIGLFLAWERTLEMYDRMIDLLISQYHAAVIYRPHPLLPAAIQAMRTQQYQKYEEFIQKYLENESFILDTENDFIPAVAASDCLISDYSSVCFSYEVTGKPVAMIIDGEPPKDNYYFAFDYRGIYFIDEERFLIDGEEDLGELGSFIEQMLRNEDADKEKRMRILKESGINLNGKSGEQIHKYVMDRIKKRGF